MKTFLRILGIFLVLAVATSAVAQDFNRAQYFKKTADGKKSDPVKGALRLDAATDTVQFLNSAGEVEFAIARDKIKSITYERTAKPRYAAGLLVAWPLLFTKSKSHYLTVQYTDNAGAAQYAIVKLDKRNYLDALAAIETRTGKKIERVEEG